MKPNRKRATQIELELSGFATAVAETASAPETLEPKSRDDAQTETSVEGRTPVTTVIRSRPPKRQNDRAVETTALKGSVPMGPVFVPAQAGSAKNRPSAGTQSKVAVMPPALTAEALARQWLSRENA